MEYSLRNKSISPPSLRQRRALNRNVKPKIASPAKSKISGSVNKPSQATSETENFGVTKVLSEEDTIGNRLCRRRSNAGNLESLSFLKTKGKRGRKSCSAKIAEKSDSELEKSPVENNAVDVFNVPVVESIIKLEVKSDVCENKASDRETIVSKGKGRRGRKSCFAKIAVISDSGEESSVETKSSGTLVDELTSEKSEVVGDFSNMKPNGGELTPSKGKESGIDKLENLKNHSGIPYDEKVLQEDSEKNILESQPSDRVSENSAVRTKRRLRRDSKECQSTEICETKVTRGNRKRKISEVCNVNEKPATPDLVSSVIDAEVTNIDSKSALISSPRKAVIHEDTSVQTETNLSCASVSSWDLTDFREVTEESSQTSYGSFSKTKGTQYSLGHKSRSTQTIVGEMVDKGTLTEDTIPSDDVDLMVLMLDAVKKLKENRCEFMISSVTNPPITSVKKDVTTPSENSNEREKIQGISKRKRRFSLGSKSKEKLEVNTGDVITHSSSDPITPPMQVGPIASKSDASDKPAVDDSLKSLSSVEDPTENSKKLGHSKSSCDPVPKVHDQTKEERIEKKRLKRFTRKYVNDSPISNSVAEKNEEDGNVKTPADESEIDKKMCVTSDNSSAFESTVSITVPVEEKKEISANKVDGELKKLPDMSEKKDNVPGCDSLAVTNAGSTHNAKRSKITLMRRTESGGGEKACSTSDSTQKESAVSKRIKRKSFSDEKKDEMVSSTTTKAAEVTSSRHLKRSSSVEKTVPSNVTTKAAAALNPNLRRSSSEEKAEKLRALKNEMTPSPTAKRSSPVENMVLSNVAKGTDMTPSPTARSLSVGNVTKRTEKTPSPISRGSSSVEITDKTLPSNSASRMERTSSPTAGTILRKARKSRFSDVVEEAKVSSPAAKDLAADVFVKPSALKIEKRSSGKGVSEAPSGVQKVGNTSKLSPSFSQRILKHQNRSGQSLTASASNMRKKLVGEMDGKGLKDENSHKDDVTGAPKGPVGEVSTGPDSSAVNDLSVEIKQEVIEYVYNKDDDDDVLSLYPESEYAEMFGSLDNNLSNVSDNYAGDLFKHPLPSVNAEANDNCLAPIMMECDMLSTKESIQKEIEEPDESYSHREKPEEMDTGEADTSNANESNNKPADDNDNNEPLVDNTGINEDIHNVDETLPVSSEQNLDVRNDTQAPENIEGGGGASLDQCLEGRKEEELNLGASSQDSEEMNKEVATKEASDGTLTELKKESDEPIMSSMEGTEVSQSVNEELHRSSTSTTSSPSRSSTVTDNTLKTDVDKWRQPPLFRRLCFRFMKGIVCKCKNFAHKFPLKFMQKVESAVHRDGVEEVYNSLMFAVSMHFEYFLNTHGVHFAAILASRKKRNYLMSFLSACAKTSCGKERFWYGCLDLMMDCGNCDEKSSTEVILFIVKNCMSKGSLDFKIYRLMLDRIVTVVSEFKDANCICQVIGSLKFTVSLSENVVRKLLHLFLSATSDFDRNKISHTVASALVVANFHVSTEDMALFHALTEDVKRNGYLGLGKELVSRCTSVSNYLPANKNPNVAPLIKRNEKSNKVTPKKQDPSKSVGLMSQTKAFGRILETEVDTPVPHKRARIDYVPTMQDQPRREGLLKNPYVAGNDIQRRPSSGGDYSHLLENPYLRVEHRQSSSSVSSVYPSISPVHRYGPNDNHERDQRDFEAAFRAPLSSPLPTSSQGSSLFPHGVRSLTNDPVCKSLPSSSPNGPGFPSWRSGLKKDNPIGAKSSFIPNCSSRESSIPGRSISPSVRKGFSKYGESSIETKSIMISDSPVVRNTHSTASSEDSSVSMIEPNLLDQPSISSAISLSSLLNKPDSASQIVLEDAFRSSAWSPILVLTAFGPWLNSPKRQARLSKLSCEILGKDFTKAASSLKSLLHCLGSQHLRSSKMFDDIKKILSTIIFNLILQMVISDAWADAYKFLRMASSANLPIFLTEAFIEEEMSISRKFLVLSEVCFRVSAMDEAIGYLNKGNLFGPVSCWKYPSLDGDLDIQVTFLSSLLIKLASGGYSETAPTIYLTIYEAQKGLYQPVDLTAHVNKVILCALNGSCVKQAYEVYSTLLASAFILPKTTYRALLIGLVSVQKYALARSLFLKINSINVYPAFRGNQIQHEITLGSYWQKEEMFIILDNAIRIIYENEVERKPSKKIPDLEMNIHIKVSETPEDLSVPWSPLKDDGSEEGQEVIPHSLALTSNSLEEAHDRVNFVLDQMCCPPILYDCIVTKEESEELLTLHPDSLAEHLYERFNCGSG